MMEAMPGERAGQPVGGPPQEEPVVPEDETEEERAEREIRAADDAVEIRVVPLGGKIGRFSYVTERILRSDSVGEQVRKVRRLIPIDGTGERGYQKRGEDVTVEKIKSANVHLHRPDWHKPRIIEEV